MTVEEEKLGENKRTRGCSVQLSPGNESPRASLMLSVTSPLAQSIWRPYALNSKTRTGGSIHNVIIMHISLLY